MSMHQKERTVISVGGSLIVPNEIDTDFLKELNQFVRERLGVNPNLQFFLVAGGGYTARKYIDAAQKVVGRSITDEDMDWQGIHSTRLNAQLLRNIFNDIAHPHVLKHYDVFIRKVEEPVVCAAGWKPGRSTDYCAVTICEDYGVLQLINLTNIDQVYDDDPRRNPEARPIDRISWANFRKIVGNEWSPGLSAPFDPIAAAKAQQLALRVVILNGKKMDNLNNFLAGKPFTGTLIEN